LSWETTHRRSIVTKQSLLIAAALLATVGVASAQNQSSQNPTSAPTEFQSSIPNKPAIATVPEAATDTLGVPVPQTSGQAPNVSKKMGAEMDSAGDRRASPDEQ
jgi:hypothetical protein